MKKLVIIAALILSTIAASAIDLSNNVCIYGGADVVSAYVFRSDLLAGASIQPYAGLVFHGDEVDWGTVDVGTWMSFGDSHNFLSFKNHSLYKECDVYASYATPGNYIKIGATYFNYMGYLGAYREYTTSGNTVYMNEVLAPWGQQVELSLEISGGDKLPLTFGWYTMVYDENDVDDNGDFLHTYSTYASLRYDAALPNDWTLTPEIGVSFGLNGQTIGYVGDQYEVDFNNLRSVNVKNLSLKADKYWQVHDLVGVHVGGFVACNLWDVGYAKFEYGKNLNVGLVAGFTF